MADTFDPVLTEPHVSNRVVKPMVRYFGEQFGEAFVQEIVEEAGLTVEYLQDTEGWTSVEFNNRLNAAVARKLYGLDALPAYDHPLWKHWRIVGRRTLEQDALGALWPFLRSMASPALFFREFERSAFKANRVSRPELLEQAPGVSRLRFSLVSPVVAESPAACWSRIGVFESVPTMFGLPPAHVDHPACMFDPVAPAAFCAYRIAYREHSYRERLQSGGVILGSAVVAAATAAWSGFSPVGAGVLGGLLGLGLEGWRQYLRLAGEHQESQNQVASLIDASDERYTRLWEEGMTLRRTLLANRKISGYLAADLVDQIMRDPELELTLGGSRIDAAVVFTDIVGFTRRCEKLTPEEVVAELNLYFAHVDQVIERYGGIIDKRIGDGIMVVFVGRQGEEGLIELRRRAVACAVGILRTLPGCNQQLEDRGSEPLQIRVGLAAGPLVQGNMGSPLKLEYTVIGDVVNLASRLEGQARPGHLLMTRDLLPALHAVADVVAERTITVKGKETPIDVVEVRP